MDMEDLTAKLNNMIMLAPENSGISAQLQSLRSSCYYSSPESLYLRLAELRDIMTSQILDRKLESWEQNLITAWAETVLP